MKSEMDVDVDVDSWDGNDEYNQSEEIESEKSQSINEDIISPQIESVDQNKVDKDLEEFLKRIPIVDANSQIDIQPLPIPPVEIKKKEKIQDMWVDKYKPKTLDDIIGNEDIIKDIIEWLAKFRKHDPDIKRAIILAGTPGVGKTTCARIISEHCGFVAHEFNASDQRSKKSLQQTMFQLAKSTDVLEFFMAGRQSDKKPKKHVIIMEEIDGMATGDYGGIAELTSVLNIKACNKRDDKWWSPIICTTNLDKIGKLKSLMRHCHVFNFDSPDQKSLQILLNKVMTCENLKISKKGQAFIIDHAQEDYRRLLFLLQTICLPKIPNPTSQIQSETTIVIEDDYIKEMIDAYEKKLSNLGIDAAMEELTSYMQPPYEKIKLDRIIALADMEYYLVPASLHENYLNWFPKKRKKRKNADLRKNDNSLDLIDIDEPYNQKYIQKQYPVQFPKITQIPQTLQIPQTIQTPEIPKIDYSKINPKKIKFVVQDENNETEPNYTMLECMCDVIDDISFKDYLFPLSNASSYDSFIQDNISLFSVAMPISHMEKYFKQSNTSRNALKLVYPKQFANVVSHTSQIKVFRELKTLLPHINGHTIEGRDVLLYFKNRMISYIENERYNDLVELLYDLEMLPEQIPILLRVREANEDNKLTKKCWTLKIQKNVIKLFEAYNEKQYKLYNLQPIDVRQDSRRIVVMN